MKRTILFFIFTSFLVLNSCGPKGPSENVKLREEVIEVHDEVMPKMGQLKLLERKSLEKVEELESKDSIDSTELAKYKAIAYDLNQSHEAMFDWMHQYETEDGEKSNEELKQYLEDQMELISKVNVDMKEALEKAHSLLK
ncbi:hypothetical protein LV84_04028 [Algoriphagus ratkowskyi]|uniref:Viral A-type inclusion protein n=1 Tax=Algoriphagus ratkowskyi TaxID=57028 RepID=A0A2W7RI69_9BACT|nr:hypothetical protein [Algoriphagus ratkowskyi]PZX50465.1 hypothetical protein LV84_04028 [Algoriphagus ratkowskyi]TXD75725.1 hypothetical protein ESW18_19410 [Algoriphagus ratkowskyi]